MDTGYCHKNKHLKTVLKCCCTGRKTVKANFESFSVESQFLGLDRESKVPPGYDFLVLLNQVCFSRRRDHILGV